MSIDTAPYWGVQLGAPLGTAWRDLTRLLINNTLQG